MRSTFIAIGAAILAGALFLAGAVRPVAQGYPEPRRPLATGGLSPRAPAGSAEARIESLERRLREAPSDWRAAAALGLLHVQHARMTSNPSPYSRADQVLRRSLNVRPGNVEALVGMGSLALARHDFRDALRWGRRAIAENPYGVAGRGVVGDALVELGRYRAGFRAFQDMADIRPGLLAYARASYARELQGDVAGARRLMLLAKQAAGSPEDAAWATFELAELFWSTGRLGRAEAAYREAIRRSPAFVAPLAGLARVSWARGRTGEAIRRYRRVVERYPAPEHVAALGDLYMIAGRPGLAGAQFALVAAEQNLFRASGVNLDVEAALFDADHGRTRNALRSARLAWSARKSVHVADALAWTLHLSGRDVRAARLAGQALRLGTRNALFFFHAAMIELSLGHEGRARSHLSQALRINPHFSIIHSPVARRMLERLEAGR